MVVYNKQHDWDAVYELKDSGHSIRAISEILNIPYSTVYYITRARENFSHETYYQQYEREMILDLWDKGESSSQIAKKLETKSVNVRAAVQRARKRGDQRAKLRGPQHKVKLTCLLTEADTIKKLKSTLKARRLSKKDFLERVITNVINDDLVTAVLDDQ